ncbi:MAG: CDP-alcohol phosphatidyltransferase family protein [Sphingomonadaceae bacterium]|nr:CDP-alcohol phosphatidyltransferase family protein [Sphingomonadaceae bacterium]
MTATPSLILFASEKAANYCVAGIPAAARAIAATSGESVLVAVPGGWQATELCLTEIQRLAPSAQWSAGDSAGLPHLDSPAFKDIPALRQESRAIIKTTGKPGDGIVSRHINRPISQAMTSLVLKWPGARPWHATLAAAMIGMAMLAALLFGEATGLVIGAALFQLASIVDGVDGEMARATFRSSARGAMLDSVTDALTNLGFIGGVSYNIWASGNEQAGLAGTLGCAILALGSAILAIQSRRDGGNFTFDALKTRVNQRPSRIRQWLTWITMRDFYAFAAFLAILAGGGAILLHVFAVVATGWFMVLGWTLILRHH